MSPPGTDNRASRWRSTARPPIVLLFGENQNDCRAVKELLLALCPRLDGRIRLRREPTVLDRDADRSKRLKQADRIVWAVKAESARETILCVFIHKDCDQVEPEHENVARDVEEQLRTLPCPVYAVVPAWTIEAWWFLWPEAVTAVNRNWDVPMRYRDVQVGLIRDAKHEFRSAIRQRGSGRGRDYRESDSPLIAEKVRALGIVSTPRARSASYDRFRRCAEACCREA